MSLKSRLFTKDCRRSSLDLSANLRHILKKLCKDKPIRLSQLKTEYDRYFKDRISTKSVECVTAALKSLADDVVAVKVHIQIDNRELTDTLLGLRSASYSSDMLNEDNPQLSKERLMHLIRECDSLGIHVQELEKRYAEFYGTRPSFLPYKSIKELLHRTPDVELASSGKTLRVRIRQSVPSIKRQNSKIPSLNRTRLTSSLRARKTQDFMTLSICKLSDSKLRPDPDMSLSVMGTSETSSDDSAASTGSGSPTGSVDMSVSMVLPQTYHKLFEPNRISRKTTVNTEADIAVETKELMATILNDLPPEGMSLKALTDEFLSILGPNYPLGMTTAEFLNQEFNHVIKLEEDDAGLRVYRMNSPLLPRRTIVDVYTKLALQSNRRPSDRVLRVLKNIYKKQDSNVAHRSDTAQSQPSPQSSARPKDGVVEIGSQKSMIRELHHRLASSTGASRIPHRTPEVSRQSVVEEIMSRLQRGPIEYPVEFQQITTGLNDDTQTLLVDLMASLNLCLRPLDGRMVLQRS